MAAEQQERERVVVLARALDARRLGALVGDRDRRGALLAPAPGDVAAHLVDEPARRHRDEPCLRMLGDALAGPLPRCREQRLLDGVLAGVEGAVPPDEHAEHLRGELTQQPLDHISIPPGSMTGRTSSGRSLALGQAAAISTARSIDSHSTMR